MIATRSRPSLRKNQHSQLLSLDSQKSKLIDDAIAQMPPWCGPLLKPHRYKALWGGRGGAKSYGICDALLILSTLKPLRILCAREFQNSMRDSSHQLLKNRIEALGLGEFFNVQRDRIIGGNGSEFLFKGLRMNFETIKSIANIDICWVEEAQSISSESWETLKPTIRADGSEIWVSFNPARATDPVYQDFIIKPDHGASYIKQVNWRDNPYFPDVLNDERLRMLARDPDAYQHIWEGGLWAKSDAQVFNGKWVVDAFIPGEDWAGPYLGADFGFAADPTTLVKCWIFDERLWIEYESHAQHLELDHTAARWREDVPDCERYVIRGDNARPESISYLKRHGVPRITACEKGKGSVEDGISHMRSFKRIVIHPRCEKTAEEFLLYSYKIDRYSGDVLPVLAPGFDHVIDAIRYALFPVMKAKMNPVKWLSKA